jgi:hypothetical protein
MNTEYGPCAVLTAAGRKQLAREAREHRTADLIAAFLGPRREVP